MDVQMAPSAGVSTSAAVGLFLAALTAYLYRRLGSTYSYPLSDIARGTIVGVAGLFSAVPAVIAGGITKGSEAFSRRISRGPRLLLGLMASMALITATMLDFKTADAYTRKVAFAVSGYALFVSLIMLYIRFGPRWRKSDTSRFKRRTQKASPVECRAGQTRWATLAFILTLAVVAAALIVEYRYKI
jgi:hypothetical protein